MKYHLAAAAAVVLLLSACSVRQEVTLSRSGAGEATVNVELHRVLIEYLADLSGFAGASMEIFDLQALEARFAQEPGLELLSATAPSAGELRLRLRFADIARVFDAQQGAVREVFSFAEDGDQRRLQIRLTPHSVRALMGFSPASDSMLADILLPPVDQPMREADYVDYLAWALEEYQRETPIASVIRSATIRVVIEPEGTIVSQRGGRTEGNRVIFEIPVVRLLTVRNTLEYSLTFR
ncbi:MAG: hypothetical protein EA404_06645 [Spirochaetaceae bacterium]|nr:MAG: hypothetical protein EA404_06645 [Spirochaetaceae bacterium]